MEYTSLPFPLLSFLPSFRSNTIFSFSLSLSFPSLLFSSLYFFSLLPRSTLHCTALSTLIFCFLLPVPTNINHPFFPSPILLLHPSFFVLFLHPSSLIFFLYPSSLIFFFHPSSLILFLYSPLLSLLRTNKIGGCGPMRSLLIHCRVRMDKVRNV